MRLRKGFVMPQNKAPRKKSASGMGSIRKITKSAKGKTYTYYEARYTLGYDPGTGKQIQRSITGKTQKEVSQKLKTITVSIDNGTYKEPCKMSVGEWLEIWITEYLSHVKPLTEQTYSEQVKRHIKPALGAAKLESLDGHMIQHFYNALSKKGLSPKTIKNIHGVLHSALEQAIKNGYISTNPSEACKLPRIIKPEIKPLEPNEITALLREAKHDTYNNIFIVALFTGMRQGELLGLTWDCIDFKNKTISIKKQLQSKDGRYFLETPKNGKGRLIFPAPIVMEALYHEQTQQNQRKLEAGMLWNNTEDLVFTDALGKNLVRRTVVKHFKAVIQRAGIESNARFHDLRHSFAVTSLSAGDDIKTVQANLGHATAQFTLDVYGHVTQKMREDSANRMQRFYEQLDV